MLGANMTKLVSAMTTARSRRRSLGILDGTRTPTGPRS
jgi:hypothetical protein